MESNLPTTTAILSCVNRARDESSLVGVIVVSQYKNSTPLPVKFDKDTEIY
jgi:hypothetical protein